MSALPEGTEKATFVKVCSGCHPATAVLGRMDTPANWAKRVERMINRANEPAATSDEAAQISAYLSRNFAILPADVHLPEAPGKRELVKVCSGCHAAEIVVNRDGHNGLRASWSNTLDRMMYRGAKATADELNLINEYLAANVGYLPAATYLPEGPGKQTVERVCGPCHGSIMLLDRRRTRAAWDRTITNMIGRGALVSGTDVQDMSEYLGRYLAPSVPPLAPGGPADAK